jgi:hypothetical protein
MFVERDEQKGYGNGKTQHHAEVDKDRSRSESVECVDEQSQRVHQLLLAQEPRAV